MAREGSGGHAARMLPRTLPDGTAVVLRPQTPQDRSRLADFFAALSPRSRYQRFLTGTPPKLPSRTLDVLAGVDDDRHVGLLALFDGDVVGAARYLRRRDRPAVADIAFTVADALQGRGLGRLLLHELRAHAARRGVTRFEFDTLATNEASLAVARSLGARLQPAGVTVEGVIYIESGAETPSRPSARAMVRRVATHRPSRNDSSCSGSAPTTRQSR
jgi:RimJ/RimL family protein N-acetyltransferase